MKYIIVIKQKSYYTNATSISPIQNGSLIDALNHICHSLILIGRSAHLVNHCLSQILQCDPIGLNREAHFHEMISILVSFYTYGLHMHLIHQTHVVHLREITFRLPSYPVPGRDRQDVQGSHEQ